MNRDEQLTFIKSEMQKAGVSLTTEQIEQLLIYFQLLNEKNKVMNLTTVSDFEGVVRIHFADSLSIARVTELTAAQSIADIGTGAGFPGLPIAIAYPEKSVVLIDSLNKRVNFLNEVISALHLKNAHTIHSRAEDGGHDKNLREKFDFVVSRAVSNLSTLSEYCLPYVKVHGVFVSYKSDQASEEIDRAKTAITKLGGTIKRCDTFHLNDTGRTLVVISKVKKTPGLYPRKAGIPGKNPI